MKAFIPLVNLINKDISLEANQSYAIEDQTVHELAFQCNNGHCFVAPLVMQHFNCKEGDKPEAGTILLLRAGAAGDLLFLKPSLERLIEMGAKPVVACLKKFHWVLESMIPSIELLEFPLKLDDSVRRFEKLSVLEYTGERYPGNNTVDLFAKYIEIELTDREPHWEP